MATFKTVVEFFMMEDLGLLKGRHEVEKNTPDHIVLEEFYKRGLCAKIQEDGVKEVFNWNGDGKTFYDDVVQKCEPLQKEIDAIVNKALWGIPFISESPVKEAETPVIKETEPPVEAVSAPILDTPAETPVVNVSDSEPIIPVKIPEIPSDNNPVQTPLPEPAKVLIQNSTDGVATDSAVTISATASPPARVMDTERSSVSAL